MASVPVEPPIAPAVEPVVASARVLGRGKGDV
jgi:hypothetical protein